jgi:hypothetical protein
LSQSGSQNIRSPMELGAKLLATAILNRASNRAQDATLGAMRSDMSNESAKILAGLAGVGATGTQVAQPPSLAPAIPPPLPNFGPPPQPEPQPAPIASAQPMDRDALARMMLGEAGGEGDTGMTAAGAVALNRLRQGKYGATLADVIHAPHQFSGFDTKTPVDAPAYQHAAQLAGALIGGQAQDPTGGAVNFLNPELTQQLTGHIPTWAQGPGGQRIGHHVFFGGTGQPAQIAAAVPAAPPPPDPNGPADQPVQPYQVASNGVTPPPSAPSAPDSSPPVAGAPPAAVPQAAAGGNPNAITPDQLKLVERLLSDPRTHDVGMAYAVELQKKAAAPTEFRVEMVNGVPTWFDPQHPGVQQVGSVPVQARTRTVKAEEIGYPAPPGTILSIDPAGNIKEVGRPPQGQMVASAPGGPYAEKPIPGGPNSPTSPANLVRNEGDLRGEFDKQVAPYIQAREGYLKTIQAAKTATPAGDIAMVFAYMKTLDPTSSVREGEQATVANSGTIPQTIQNMYNKMLTGEGKLTPDQRTQFVNSAKQQFAATQNTFDQASSRYGELAKSYGFDPTHVVRRFDPIPDYAPNGPSSAASAFPDAVNRAHANMVARGEYDASAPLGSEKRPFLTRSAQDAQALDVPQNRGKHVVMPDGSIAVVH